MRHAAVILCLLATLSSCAPVHAQFSDPPSSEQTWGFTYNDEGWVTSYTDPAGRVTNFLYEYGQATQRLDRIIREQEGVPRVAFGFDEFGRRTSMDDATGKTAYEYDPFGRLTNVRNDGRSEVSYTHDTLNRVKSMRVGEDLTVEYNYDFLGRLSEIRLPRGSVTYEYLDAQLTIVRSLPSGIRTHWQYRPDGNLDSISHVAGDNSVLEQYTYSYRADGLVDGIREWRPHGERILRFGYDDVQRLTEAIDSKGNRFEYKYDELGNRTEVIRNGVSLGIADYDWAGRMTSCAGTGCTHGAAGELTSYDHGGTTRRFGFDAMDRLTSVSAGNVNVDYTYNGDGHLVARTVGRQRTTFVPDPLADRWQPLAEISRRGQKTHYVWDGGLPLAAIERDRTTFFLQDHMGSVRSTHDDRGSLIQRFDYDPFGVPYDVPADRPFGPGFGGSFYDDQARVHPTLPRAYDPQLGRYLQVDPLGTRPDGLETQIMSYGSGAAGAPVSGGAPAGAGFVWGPSNFGWQVLHHIFDASCATQWYAEQAERAIRSSTPSTWILCGLEATAYDLIGGVIGGEPANEGQRRAQLMWSLASLGGASAVLTATGGVRSAVSAVVNVSEGHPVKAALDLASVGGAVAAQRATDLAYGVHGLPDKQLAFGFGIPEVVDTADKLTKASEAMRAGDALRVATDAVVSEFEAIEGGGAGDPLEPSPVGGVYLRGAGEALKGLGPLKGVAVDEMTGRVSLLFGVGGVTQLPDLSLDDVVTVFRSVYEHGDAPNVTIDPNPTDPRGPVMLVKHGEGTSGTFVGWVLFEADRVMKAYSLGHDNVTREPVTSSIDGYRHLIDLGFSSFGESRTEPIWERFWIVPAKVERERSTEGAVTLVDVPLKVRTQRMELVGGVLVPAKNDTPSAAAQEFADWFTRSYEGISREVTSQAPESCSREGSVAVFGELRRLAAVAAVAEALRDQGVPMPQWMREHEVTGCPASPTTPAIEVTATETAASDATRAGSGPTTTGIRVQRIYGGVDLSPRTEDIVTRAGGSGSGGGGTGRRSKDDDSNGNGSDPDSVASAVRRALTDGHDMGTLGYYCGDAPQVMVTFPGDRSRALGACRLLESDLRVQMQGLGELDVVREFSSFSRPEDVFGGAWTLDLPQLQHQPVPISRTDEKTTYRVGYQLFTPLGSASAVFRDTAYVAELGGELLVPTTPSRATAVGSATDDRIGFRTTVVYLRDGRRWHFDDAGRLVATIDGPGAVIYRRATGSNGRILRKEGWHDEYLLACIDFDHDASGRIVAARTSDGAVTRYEYGPGGMLTRVTAPGGVVGYAYRDGLVTAVSVNGVAIREYEYDGGGRLRAERGPDGVRATYEFTRGRVGPRISASGGGASTWAEYDGFSRAVDRKLEDGTRIRWQHRQNGAASARVILPSGREHTAHRSADGMKFEWHTPGGGTCSALSDPAGRTRVVRRGDVPALELEWRSDGRPERIKFETAHLHPEYTEHGALKGLLVAPPGARSPFTRWSRVDLDVLGRPTRLTDHTGSAIRIGYDETGELSAFVTGTGWVEIMRDALGRVVSAQTSWGRRQENAYDTSTGALKEVKLSLGDEAASLEYAQGRPVQIRQFDGSSIDVAYVTQGPNVGAISRVRAPDGLTLVFQRSDDGRLERLVCGGAYEVAYAYDPHGRLTRMTRRALR